MDVRRPSSRKAKLKRRVFIGGGVAIACVITSIFVARLKPAAPTINRNLVLIDTVKRGPLLRTVHGAGTLVPEDIRWIAARTQARVERILLRPGASVTPDSIILVLSNPSVEQSPIDADSQLGSAEADLANTQVQLESNVLQVESDAANANAAFEQAQLKAEVSEQLFKKGLDSDLNVRLSKVTATQNGKLNSIAQKRYAFAQESITPQIAVKQAAVNQIKAQARLRHAEVDALTVRAGVTGVLQIVPVEVGAQVEPGANLARVADPTHLKATIQITETQANDIQVGQTVQIDTHNGLVGGKVSRVDPSVKNNAVSVDVTLGDAPVPPGARPDLSVDGTIEIQRLDNVVFMGRPSSGAEQSSTSLFKLDPDGSYATRIRVQLGRGSVSEIEIVTGLEPGDRVILSDMSRSDGNDRVKLK